MQAPQFDNDHCIKRGVIKILFFFLIWHGFGFYFFPEIIDLNYYKGIIIQVIFSVLCAMILQGIFSVL